MSRWAGLGVGLLVTGVVGVGAACSRSDPYAATCSAARTMTTAPDGDSPEDAVRQLRQLRETGPRQFHDDVDLLIGAIERDDAGAPGTDEAAARIAAVLQDRCHVSLDGFVIALPKE